MPRKPIENADERIIEATFKIGGNSPRGSLSTKDIAVEAGLSEFTIFSRFTTKENLISTCNGIAYEIFLKANLQASNNHKGDRRAFFDEVLDKLIGSAEMTKFAGNYSLVFPRQDSVKAYAVFFDSFHEKWKPLFDYFPLETEEQKFRVIAYGVREIIQDALYIISGEVKDTPENRTVMFDLFYGGMKEFVTIA